MSFSSSSPSAVGFVEISSSFSSLFSQLRLLLNFVCVSFLSLTTRRYSLSIHLEKVSMFRALLNANKLCFRFISFFIWWWCQQLVCVWAQTKDIERKEWVLAYDENGGCHFSLKHHGCWCVFLQLSAKNEFWLTMQEEQRTGTQEKKKEADQQK